jgi:hypothetical protein
MKNKRMKGLKIAAVVAFTAGVGWFIYSASAGESSDLQTNGSNEPTFSPESVDYSILPCVHYENLDVFLIEQEPELTEKTYLTLADALEKKYVTVEETGSVNELVVHNHSDEYVFIHSGDIVKGGKQDRTLAFDMILPPNTQNIPIQSFCVESGRWTNRAGEDVSQFNESTKMLSSKDLKAAAKYDKNQSSVWANVSQEQQKLNANLTRLNGSTVQVQDAVSATSLQLTLENEELEKAKSAMNDIYLPLIDQYPNATGFAYAINGEVYGADLYNNRALFEALWERLMESVITESIANLHDTTYQSTTPETVFQFMYAVSSSPDSTVQMRTESINALTEIEITENDSGNVVFSTIDLEAKRWIHQNYLFIEPRTEENNEDLPIQLNQILFNRN